MSIFNSFESLLVYFLRKYFFLFLKSKRANKQRHILSVALGGSFVWIIKIFPQ